MSDDWADKPTSFGDLESKAAEIYDLAVHEAGCVDKAAEMAKMWDVALKALRLHAELREKTDRPERIERLTRELEKTRAALTQHHAGTDDRTRTADDTSGEPPTWRVQ